MGGEKKSGKGNKKIGRWKPCGPVFAETWATKNSYTERMLTMIRRRETRHASD